MSRMKLFNTRFQKQSFVKIMLLCFSLGATLLLCEAVLQFSRHSAQRKGYFPWPPGLKAVFKPSPDIMPGISGESRFIINSQGIRADELTPQHAYRILAIGGSTTECEYLDQSEIWPYLLQEKLNRNSPNRQVWVGDGGVSGLTSRHHLVAMQHLPLKEMKIDVVLLLVGINDLTRRLSHEKDYDPDYLNDSGAREELMAQTFTGTYNSYSNDPLYKRTATWQLLRRVKMRMTGKHFEDQSGKVYTTWREHRRHASEIRNELPDLSSALEEYARNINRIIDLSQEKAIRLILITQPTMWRPDLPQDLSDLLWLGGVGDFQVDDHAPYYSLAALEKGMKAYNETLLRVARERRIECLDLASMLEKDSTVFYDDVHFNESGSRKVAEALSRYLIEQDRTASH